WRASPSAGGAGPVAEWPVRADRAQQCARDHARRPLLRRSRVAPRRLTSTTLDRFTRSATIPSSSAGAIFRAVPLVDRGASPPLARGGDALTGWARSV